MKRSAFYEKYDKISPTITLIQDEKGNLFGGYASISWIFDKKYFEYTIPDSFLFTLDNIYNIQPTLFPIKLGTKKHNFKDIFSSFSELKGLGLVPTEELSNGIRVILVGPYEDILGKGSSIFTGDPNDPYKEIKIKEIEVFKLLKKNYI